MWGRQVFRLGKGDSDGEDERVHWIRHTAVWCGDALVMPIETIVATKDEHPFVSIVVEHTGRKRSKERLQDRPGLSARQAWA